MRSVGVAAAAVLFGVAAGALAAWVARPDPAPEHPAADVDHHDGARQVWGPDGAPAEAGASTAVPDTDQKSDDTATSSTVTTSTPVSIETEAVEPAPAVVAAFADSLGWLESVDERDDVEFTAAVWVEGHGEVWSWQPDLELHPASNQKLLVAIGAAELLEPGQVFRTEVLPGAETGTIVVRAGGDPTLTGDDLADLAIDVAANVATAIDRVVIDPGRWSDGPLAPGWQDWQVPTYMGPLSTFMVDDNRWTTAEAFVADPDLVNGRRFADALAAIGVRGDLVVSVEPGVSETLPDVGVIAAHESPSVRELSHWLLAASDNQIAEALVREIDVITGGSGTTAGGLAAIRSALADVGIEVDGTDGDGSGLSRTNLRSAGDWVEVLVAVQDRPYFAQFHDWLAVAGRSGTLRGRLDDSPTGGNVHAKTGTIIGGRALSGYLTLPGGERAVFSIVVNGDGAADMTPSIDQWTTALASTALAA